ncbi:HAD-superfamily hydrolase [Halalkaliarchaeum desulfuricum]|uniref:HAD-superfamily hydrolase n=2 Tax=Halalkaliarchaeum desulfuricum TaxID=2055893 RepID=A0A343TGP3_9EURY|nr:HAD-superfamily hydrolase [Halalkaliarchaeum desulfuricum]
MDGVLLRGRETEPWVYARAADYVIEELDLSPSDPQRELLRKHRCDEEIVAVCETLGVSLETFWERKEAHASRIENRRIRDGERTPFEDAEAVFELARDRQLGVVSNNRHETVEFVAEYLEFDEVLEYVRGRDPTVEAFRQLRKPNPHYIFEALASLDNSDGWYVGDRPKDMLAAERAGLDGIFLRRTFNQKETPDVEPTHEIDSLYELKTVLPPENDDC